MGMSTGSVAARRRRFPSGLRLVNLGVGAWIAAVFGILYLPIGVLVRVARG